MCMIWQMISAVPILLYCKKGSYPSMRKTRIRHRRKWPAVVFVLLFFAMTAGILYHMKLTHGRDGADADGIADTSQFASMENMMLSRYKEYTKDTAGHENGVYEYDGDGNLIAYESRQCAALDGAWLRKISKSEFSKSETLSERALLYNGAQKPVNEAVYRNGKLVSLTKCSYYDGKAAKITANIGADGAAESYHATICLDNEEQEKLAEYYYNAEGTLDRYTYTCRDEKGRAVFSQYGTDASGESPSREMTIRYNDEKNTSREESFIPIGHLNQYQKNTYNSENNLICGLRYGHKFNGGPKDVTDEDMILNEGYWADYSGGKQIWEMQYGYNRLKSYDLYCYNMAQNPTLHFAYEVDNNVAHRTLHRFEYDGDGQLKAEYIYRVGKEDFTFQRDDGTYTVVSFYQESGSISTITYYYADGHIDEQYSFLDQGKMLWHDVYSYERPGQTGTVPFETVIYRGDVEGNLLDTLKSGKM